MRISDWSSDVCSSDLTRLHIVIQHSLHCHQQLHARRSFLLPRRGVHHSKLGEGLYVRSRARQHAQVSPVTTFWCATPDKEWTVQTRRSSPAGESSRRREAVIGPRRHGIYDCFQGESSPTRKCTTL